MKNEAAGRKFTAVKQWMHVDSTDNYSGDLSYRYEIITEAYVVARVICEHGSWNTYLTNSTLPLTVTGLTDLSDCVIGIMEKEHAISN